ncbi:MAG: hypothetical protein NVSMB52_01190 [Chloroflexota bacterium]
MRSLALGGVFTTGLLVMLVAGCGAKQTYSDVARSDIANLRKVIAMYDSVRPTDVGSTGKSCQLALDSIGTRDALATPPTTGIYRRLGATLADAYDLARSGFQDCSHGAAQNNFLRMVRADIEFREANVWLIRARHLDQ